MKKTMILLTLLVLATGCSKSKNILFCEGVSKNGEGVKCGTKFAAGDLSAVLTSGQNFESEQIIIEVYKENGKKEEKIETILLTVKPDANTANFPLSFYNPGTYTVKAVKGREMLGDGKITVVE